MNKNTLSLLLAVLSMTMWSCSTEQAPDSDVSSNEGGSILRLSIDRQDMTRGAITSSSFEDGDSVFVVVRDSEHPDLLTFTTAAVYSGGEWTLSDQIDLSAKRDGVEWTSAKVEVYYPYGEISAAFDPENPDRIRIEDPLNQTDILYGIVSGVDKDYPEAHIRCNHMKTRLTFAFNNKTGLPASITKMNIRTDGRYDVLAKLAYLDSGYLYVPDEYDYTYLMPCDLEIPVGETRTLDFLMPPTAEVYQQMVDYGGITILLIELDVNDRYITFEINTEDWKPGKQYIYPVNIPEARELTGIIDGHEFVDLDCSVLWATHNIGAATPYDSGLYFQWGSKVGHTADSEFWANQEKAYEFYGLTFDQLVAEQIILPQEDGTYKLNIKYDAARANWGGGWRMPTRAEIEEFNKACSFRWDAEHVGMKNRSYYTGMELFLPGARYIYGGKLTQYPGGSYWSSDFAIDTYNRYGWLRSEGLLFIPESAGNIATSPIYEGLPIRPVIDRK